MLKPTTIGAIANNDGSTMPIRLPPKAPICGVVGLANPRVQYHEWLCWSLTG